MTVSAASLVEFTNPVLRHLAWICQAPQLLHGPLVFNLASQLPAGTLDKLQEWNVAPEEAPAVVHEPPHRRLGIYFEALYECLMTELLGWEMLARNLPVRGEGRTLGELDFLFRNPRDGAIEHHEIAVKFYLGLQSSESSEVRWYGPNAHDRLDIKTRRLLEHQIPLARRPETIAALKALGLPLPSRSRVFMPGYLFYPDGGHLAPPPQAPPDHARGRWLRIEDARQEDTRYWKCLYKPHWLGPWLQQEAPNANETDSVLSDIEQRQVPRLFARLETDGASGRWLERERLFVVPVNWPLMARDLIAGE